MRKGIVFTVCAFVFAIFGWVEAGAAEEFFKARVQAVLDQGEQVVGGYVNPYQMVKLRFLSGDMKGSEMVVEQGRNASLDKNQLVVTGNTVVVLRSTAFGDEPVWQIIDKYRIDRVWPMVIFFFLIIVFLASWQGVGSIVGMVVSLVVIGTVVVPQILAGKDPLMVSIAGCLVILTVTIYLAHGFSRKTTVAVVATFLTLVLTGLLSVIFVKLAHLTGLGNEEAYSLRIGLTAGINFRGLLLGGILIGALGVLDDVTTGLAAAVFELAKANPKYKFTDLFQSGLVIGREHVASLVNTLVLAYAGTSLPIFLTLILNPNNYPMWMILNSELIMEEVVRTLAGSIGLVAAVPLTTFLAAWYVARRRLA